MPECGIGLYPDVGASFFLNQIPARMGLLLGLTGLRLKGAQPACRHISLTLLHCNIATACVIHSMVSKPDSPCNMLPFSQA